MIYQTVSSNSTSIQKLQIKVNQKSKYLIQRKSKQTSSGKETKAKRRNFNDDETKQTEIMVDKSKVKDFHIVSITSNTINPYFPRWFMQNGENAKLDKAFNKSNTLSINIPLI